jgi:hypothetical protein
MKLNLFSPVTFPKSEIRSNSKPSISFGKSGVISFNPAAIRLMELNAGDGIIIASDDECPSDYYVTKNSDGYPLRLSSGTGNLIFNHKSLCEKVMTLMELEVNVTHRIMISNSPVDIEGSTSVYYGLLGVINRK